MIRTFCSKHKGMFYCIRMAAIAGKRGQSAPRRLGLPCGFHGQVPCS